MNRPRRLAYAWTDLPFMVLAVVLLLPLLIHLAEIVVDFVADTR